MLGPLEVRDDADTVVEVGGARLRALLILLALDPGRVVPTARLIDALWEDQVPAGATNALQALVSRLRRTVPGIAVKPRPAGYQLDLDPDAVDVRPAGRTTRWSPTRSCAAGSPTSSVRIPPPNWSRCTPRCCAANRRRPRKIRPTCAPN